MYRLRRLCLREEDFSKAMESLKNRCHNSGYSKEMVKDILKEANTLIRDLHPKKQINIDTKCKIRWVTLSHSHFEKETTEFVRRMNSVLENHHIGFEVIKTTAPSISNLLFNNCDNCDKSVNMNEKCRTNCFVCKNNARGDRKCIVSSVTRKKYYINPNINCVNSGIYGVTCKCVDQYGGKTTVSHGVRYQQHWVINTTVKEHLNSCKSKPTVNDVKVL